MFNDDFDLGFDIDWDEVLESAATNLRRDTAADAQPAISLKSLYFVPMNEGAIEKYGKEYHQLNEVNKNAEKLRGYLYFKKGELVCFFSIEYHGDKAWIDTLHVVKKYRGSKLSWQLLDVAVRKFHAYDLRVHKENNKAINIFKHYGFKVYDKKNQWLYMSINQDRNVSNDNKYTKSNTPNVKDVRSENIKKAGAKEVKDIKASATRDSILDTDFTDLLPAQEAFGFNKQKPVEELLMIAERDLGRRFKTPEDCDEYLKVINNESRKFNEALNALISAKAKYEKSKKTKEDKEWYRSTTKAAIKLIKGNCKALKVRLGEILPGKTEDVSREDIKRVATYISGLRTYVNGQKRWIKNGRPMGDATKR